MRERIAAGADAPGSRYLEWAKSRAGIRWNLSASGVRACPLELLDPVLEDLAPAGANTSGWPPLLEALGARYGVDARRIVLATGASLANHLVCATLLQPGDEVLLESPTYEPLHAVPRYLHAGVRFFERARADAYAVDPERVRAALTPRTRLLVLTNLHNPSGALIGAPELIALAELADAHDLHVLVDEVYLEWLHAGGHGSAVHVSPRFVTTRSLTKAYGLDGVRVGWILAAPELAERIRRVQNLFFTTLAMPSERLATRALARATALLAPLEALTAHNRDVVDAFVAAEPRLSWLRPPAGTVGFVRLDGGDVDALVERLETRYDTTVAPGRFFGDPAAFRIGFGMDTAVLEEGLRRLAAALG
ncbi:MAG TPA: aminotransferase class I/II-fold pyridoxal phosphate-dependent enzyme [Longimicrobiales bacterium]|nr:aminotransferase class I/II-fold pyridoxal phosphate-dependent enzyme [Longimicrobiales bacterium]